MGNTVPQQPPQEGGARRVQLAGPKPVFFFAPAWIATRAKEMGGMAGLMTKAVPSWLSFVRAAGSWMNIRTLRGAKEVREGYATVLDTGVDPDTGLIMTMWGSDHDPFAKIRWVHDGNKDRGEAGRARL